MERCIGLHESVLVDEVASISTAWKQICVVKPVIEVVKAGPLFMARRQGPLTAISVEKCLGHAAEQLGHGQIHLPVPPVWGGIEDGADGQRRYRPARQRGGSHQAIEIAAPEVARAAKPSASAASKGRASGRLVLANR